MKNFIKNILFCLLKTCSSYNPESESSTSFKIEQENLVESSSSLNDVFEEDQIQQKDVVEGDPNQKIDHALNQDLPTVTEQLIGSLGIGLTSVHEYSGAWQFLDLMKQSSEWGDWSHRIEGFDLDENDWVKSLKPNQTAGIVFLGNHNEAIKYKKLVVLYDGDGLIEYHWSAKKLFNESNLGRDVIEIGQGNHLLSIVQTNPENYIKNIRIVPIEFESLLIQGEVFNPDWINKIKHFAGLRFLNWMNPNSKISHWNERVQRQHRTWTRSVPLEIMIELSNQLKIVPWFTISHLVDEDYMAHSSAKCNTFFFKESQPNFVRCLKF